MEANVTTKNIQQTFKDWEKTLSAHALFSSIQEKGAFFFVPKMEFFVGSFKDILLLLSEKFKGYDDLGDEIAHHAEEDGNHWQWYFKDISTLANASEISGTIGRDALWGNAGEVTRMTSHKFIHMAQTAKNPLEAMLIIEVLEFAYKIFIEGYQKQLEATSIFDNLIYFGQHHIEEELSHSHEMWAELTEEKFADVIKEYTEKYNVTDAQWQELDKKNDLALSMFNDMWSEWAK